MGQFLTRNSADSDLEIVSNLSEPPPDNITIDDILATEQKIEENCYIMEEQIITMDSNRTDPNFSIKNVKLTLDQVTEIESRLDTYEKVSLVFLLYENSHLALQDLEMYILGTKKEMLHNWAFYEEKQGNVWSLKLIEALCIIQNYEILNLLGYKKNELCSYFLPTSEYCIISIDKTRKLLYLACERLTSEETKTFLSLVKEELSRKELDIKAYDSVYLEMYLLHWMTIRYISTTDVDNIICVFKQMGLDNICQLLKLISQETHTSDDKETSLSAESKANSSVVSEGNNRTDTFTTHYVVDQSLYRESSLRESHSGDLITRYEVDPKKPGYCFIINQKNFYLDRDPQNKELLPPPNSNPLERRDGTDIDVEHLTQTFQNFGYTVEVFTNLKHSEIIPEIRNALNRITDESSVFVCILSHGTAGAVYGVNCCKVSFEDIKSVMCDTNREHLRNKAKFLILQSCQGQNCQKIDVEENTVGDADAEENTVEDADADLLTHDGINSAPKLADLFTINATVKGFGAIRHKKRGTWFIKSLCENMMKYGHEKHFGEICTNVVNDVHGKKFYIENEMYEILLDNDSTLRWSFYFPPLFVQNAIHK